MKKYLKYMPGVLLIILVLLATTFAFKYFNEKNKASQLESNLEVIKDNWKFKIDSKDSTIATQQQVILDKNSKLAKQADTIKGLKTQTQRIKIVTRTVIKNDTIEILADNTLTIDSTTYLRLPYRLYNASKWYGYSFTLLKDKVVLDSLYFNSETHVVWGQQDRGWLKNIFKPNLPIVKVINNNPFTRTTEIENYTFKDYKQKRLSLSYQAGYGLTQHGIGWYTGIGISYRLIGR